MYPHASPRLVQRPHSCWPSPGHLTLAVRHLSHAVIGRLVVGLDFRPAVLCHFEMKFPGISPSREARESRVDDIAVRAQEYGGQHRTSVMDKRRLSAYKYSIHGCEPNPLS